MKNVLVLQDTLAKGLNRLELTTRPSDADIDHDHDEGPYSALPWFDPDASTDEMYEEILLRHRYYGIYDCQNVKSVEIAGCSQGHFRQLDRGYLRAHAVVTNIWAGIGAERKFVNRECDGDDEMCADYARDMEDEAEGSDD